MGGSGRALRRAACIRGRRSRRLVLRESLPRLEEGHQGRGEIRGSRSVARSGRQPRELGAAHCEPGVEAQRCKAAARPAATARRADASRSDGAHRRLPSGASSTSGARWCQLVALSVSAALSGPGLGCSDAAGDAGDCLASSTVGDAVHPQQQWYATGIPPWHLWGNTQQQSVLPLGGGAVPLVATASQLCKVEYGRPETWHWLFQAKLLSGPNTVAPGDHVTLTVHWDLIVGIGRSAMVLTDFDVFSFNWNDGAAFPFGQQIWSNQTLSPAKAFTSP